jgi:hypothetical protein
MVNDPVMMLPTISVPRLELRSAKRHMITQKHEHKGEFKEW